MTEDAIRCGFVALVGAPNAGKSTLINRLVGTKVSIVTPKAQTTRARVLGIVMRGVSQLIFMDTPGIHSPRRGLERAMVESAWRGVADTDHIALLIDASSIRKPDVYAIIKQLDELGHKAILVLNKIDLVPRSALLELSAEFNSTGIFIETFMISGLTGDGVEDLLNFLAGHASEGPWLFPEDQISDMPQRLMAAEITREKLFLQLHQELPYSLTVETEGWEDRRDGSVKIDQVIYVRRDSQKAIVLGHGGSRVKSVGQAARLELVTMLDRRVHLFLFVKVREKWVDDRERFEPWGLRHDA
jgi:GTP-binding protein Era